MSRPKIILFSGHRDKRAKQEDLYQLAKNEKDAVWIHGDALGFDKQVGNTAELFGINTGVFRPAYNDKSIRTTRFAPIKRNQIMLDLADEVVVLWDGRRSGGTYWTMTEAKERGLDVTVLKPDA